MKRTFKTLIFITTLLSFSQVSANDSAGMENQVNKLATLLKLQAEANYKILDNPKMLKANATYLHNYYLALVDSGFSKSQAMEIVVASVASNKS